MTDEAKKPEPQQGLLLTLEEAQQLINWSWKMPTEFGMQQLQLLQAAQRRALGAPAPVEPPPAAPPKKGNGKAAHA